MKFSRDLCCVAAGILFVLAAASSTLAAAPPKDGQHSDGGGWGFKRITADDPKLPRVLLVGDSIANGYHKEVATQLKGKANVDLFITPDTVASKNISKELKDALAHGPYAVIHFNECGLHAWSKGTIPEGQYGPLMEQYVKTLKENGGAAVLAWASSTPVTVKGNPGQLDEEVNATVDQNNQAARKVVEKESIAVDDLYALMIDKLKLARGDRWHWTKAGSDLQAHAVTEAILTAMAKPVPPPPPR